MALIALGASAMSAGDLLYVASKEAFLLEKPDERSKVLMTLSAQTEVLWQGPAAQTKAYARVQVAGVSGYVESKELTANKPLALIGVTPSSPGSLARICVGCVM